MAYEAYGSDNFSATMSLLSEWLDPDVIRQYVEEDGKTIQEVFELLTATYSDVDKSHKAKGLSERSLKRFCSINGIGKRSNSACCSRVELNKAVSEAVAEVMAQFVVALLIAN